MGCPHCKLSLGWGPVQEYPEGAKWYKPVNPRLKCNHCGKYVISVRNGKYKWLGFFCFFAAWLLLRYWSGSVLLTLVLIVLLIGFLYAVVGYASNVHFEKEGKT